MEGSKSFKLRTGSQAKIAGSLHRARQKTLEIRSIVEKRG